MILIPRKFTPYEFGRLSSRWHDRQGCQTGFDCPVRFLHENAVSGRTTGGAYSLSPKNSCNFVSSNVIEMFENVICRYEYRADNGRSAAPVGQGLPQMAGPGIK